MVYHKDLIWRPGRLFTFGIQGEGAYLKQGGNQGQTLVVFLRTSRTKLWCLFEKDKKRNGKRACCLYILPGGNEEPRKRGKHFIRVTELCTHMDIIVERLRRRPLFFLMELHVNNKAKMNHGWSQCKPTLTVKREVNSTTLKLKQNRGAYWYETANPIGFLNRIREHFKKKTNSRGALLREEALITYSAQHFTL